MKNLVTKRYKGYTYHVEANGDYYVACKKFKGLYMGFTADNDHRITIRQLVNGELGEDLLLKSSKQQMLEDAAMQAKEAKNAKTH